MEKVNHASVSQNMVQCCSDFNIDFQKIMLFVSDSASYFSKAWKEILSLLWTNCQHIHCYTHIISLAGNSMRIKMPDVDRCISLLKSCLVKAPARRNRFIRHLESCGIVSPSLPLEPVLTRWNTWFDAVIFLAPLLSNYSTFINKECEEEGGSSAALLELTTLLLSNCLSDHFSFVASNCPRFIAILNIFQSRKLQIHEVYNIIQDLYKFHGLLTFLLRLLTMPLLLLL